MKELEDIEKKLGEGFEAKITSVEEMRSKDYFGEDSKFEDRDGYCINCIITNVKDGAEFKNFYNKPEITGLQKSNVYAFKKKYGKYPENDMKIKAIINENGFFEIEI